jgi:Ca2+-binding EF-hand superfamily protein
VLKSFDKNGDGKISREEAEPAEILSRGFDKVDVDRDGFASKDEIQQALNKYLGRAN